MDKHTNKQALPRHSTLAAAVCAACLFPPMAQAADDGGWDWLVAPYLWAVSIGTDLERTVPPAGGVSSDTGFDDVVSKLDGAFQVHVEGRGGDWGMFSDFTYLGLADEKDFTRFHTESDLDTRLFEIAGVWSPNSAQGPGLDLFAGLRYIDVDMSVKFDPVAPIFPDTDFDGGKSFSDLMVGARYNWRLSDRWGLTLRGDGSWGGTEGTWNASAVANYRTKNGGWLFGYRCLNVKLKTGDTDTNLRLSGPEVGYGFNF